MKRQWVSRRDTNQSMIFVVLFVSSIWISCNVNYSLLLELINSAFLETRECSTDIGLFVLPVAMTRNHYHIVVVLRSDLYSLLTVRCSSVVHVIMIRACNFVRVSVMILYTKDLQWSVRQVLVRLALLNIRFSDDLVMAMLLSGRFTD